MEDCLFSKAITKQRLYWDWTREELEILFVFYGFSLFDSLINFNHYDKILDFKID